MHIDKGYGYEEIYGINCYLPKMPKVRDIENSHLPIKDQKWKRQELPSFHKSQVDIFSGDEYPDGLMDWDACRREEIIKQTGEDPWKNNAKVSIVPDPDYVMDVLEDYRRQEWDRCDPWSGGYWFMNNGKPVWLTPFHYFYLQWWKSDNGYPEYRDTDRKKFYYWQWVFMNPVAHGMVEAASRGQGKSVRALAVVYLTTIYTKNCISGMQSKTDDDAKDLFQIKLVGSYKALPDFFVPENNNSSDPKSSLDFMARPVKGKAANMARKKSGEALNSTINYKNSQANAYDGQTINGILYLDEEGKTETCDVYERHKIVEKCVYRDGKLRGKIYSTTTVAEIEKGGENYKKVWEASNPAVVDQYGQTKSKLFRIFIPAYETEFFDEYGYPVIDNPTPEQKKYLEQRYGHTAIEGARPYQAAKRQQAENDPQALLLEILQAPWSERELFAGAGATTPYNLTILRNQEQYVNEEGFNKVRIGDFVWEGGLPGGKVRWVDNPKNGKWHVSYLFPDPDLSNKCITEPRAGRQMPISSFGEVSLNICKPSNNANFAGGFDPTKVHASASKSRSKAAGTIYRKADYFDPDLSDTWIADYVWEPDNPFQAWIDFLAGCVYYGCEFLAEDSTVIPVDLFKKIGYYNFIMWRPRNTITARGRAQFREGLPATGTMNDRMIQLKQEHIINHGYKLLLKRVIHDSITFNPEERTKFDLEVASQLSLMASTKPVVEEESTVNIGDIFGLYDNTGKVSKQL